MAPDTSAHERPAPTVALLPFTLVTFAISWGIPGPHIFFPETTCSWFGEITGKHPVFVLAVWAPAFAAFAVVLPILQRHMAPCWDGPIIGAMWVAVASAGVLPERDRCRAMLTRDGAVIEVSAPDEQARRSP